MHLTSVKPTERPSHQVEVTRQQLNLLLERVVGLLDRDAEALDKSLNHPRDEDEVGRCCDRLEADFRFREAVLWGLRQDQPHFSTLDHPEVLEQVTSRLFDEVTKDYELVSQNALSDPSGQEAKKETQEALLESQACRAILNQLHKPNREAEAAAAWSAP